MARDNRFLGRNDRPMGHWFLEELDNGQWALTHEMSGGTHRKIFSTREAAVARYRGWENNGHCIECGDVLNDEYLGSVKDEIHERKLCFGCLFWMKLVEQPERSAIINGRHYQIANEDSSMPDHARGFAGAAFRIQFHDGRQVRSTNLWTQGVIPEHFRDRLPDNAVFENAG